MTNLDVVTAVLQMIGIIMPGRPASPEDATTTLTELNDLLSEYEEDRIDLGYFAQTDMSADCPLSDSSISLVKPLLAKRMRVHFPTAIVPPELLERAIKNENRMYRTAVIDNAEEARMNNLPRSEGRRRYRGRILTGN